MNNFNTVLIVIILLMLPISVYLNYSSYLKISNNEVKKYYLDFALLSSFYLLIKFEFYKDIYMILFFNIPLLIAFVKNRKFSVFLMSFLLIYFYSYLSFNLLLLIFEYLIYILVYYYCLRKKKSLYNIINVFIIFESFTIGFLYFFTTDLNAINVDSIYYLFFIISLFIISTYVLIYLFI